MAPVQLDFDIHKDKDKFRLVGTCGPSWSCRAAAASNRSGCRWTAPFDVRICRRRSWSAEDEREVQDEDLDTSYYRDDQIDLNELLREQFYLALPMKPLCREDCAGLCPQCGTNLNTGTCQCTTEWEDPRLAPLKGLE